jgi:hypothetical protein
MTMGQWWSEDWKVGTEVAREKPAPLPLRLSRGSVKIVRERSPDAVFFFILRQMVHIFMLMCVPTDGVSD